MQDIYKGEQCGPCFREGHRNVDATHKVGEELPAGAPPVHNFTQYICCLHFERLMGRHSGICALVIRAPFKGRA